MKNNFSFDKCLSLMKMIQQTILTENQVELGPGNLLNISRCLCTGIYKLPPV